MRKSLIAELAVYAIIGTSVYAFAKTRTSCPFRPAPTSAKTEAKSSATIETISPQQAQEMMQAGAKMVDVRESEEYETVRVAGSTLIPLAQVKAAPKRAALAPKVLLMCHSGRRAQVAADAMKHLPNLNLFVIKGGITGWQQAGLPVQKGK